MTITSTQTTSGDVVNRAVGRYLTDTTAAEFDITTGFKPRFVRIVNVTSLDQMEWYEGMASDSAVKTVAAGTRTLLVADAIIPLEDGFTVGLDTDVNVTNQQISWIATA